VAGTNGVGVGKQKGQRPENRGGKTPRTMGQGRDGGRAGGSKKKRGTRISRKEKENFPSKRKKKKWEKRDRRRLKLRRKFKVELSLRLASCGGRGATKLKR